MKNRKFKMPNALIGAAGLKLSTRRVGAYLYAYQTAGVYTDTIRGLAEKIGMAPGTVNSAIRELEDSGYISIHEHFRWDNRKGRPLRASNTYQCKLGYEDGYSLIPYALLNHKELTSASFCLCLYLYRTIGGNDHGYPSIRRMTQGVGISNSTVCAALKIIKRLPLFFVELCRKISGSFTSSSYFSVSIGEKPAYSATADRNLGGGSLRKFIVNGLKRLHKLFYRPMVTRFLTHNRT